MLVEALERRLRVALVAQLGVAVVLDDRARRCAAAQASSCIRRATGIVPPPGYCHDGVTSTAAGPSGSRSTRQPAVVDRDVDQRHPAGLERPREVRAARDPRSRGPRPLRQPQPRRRREARPARRPSRRPGRGVARTARDMPEVGRELGAQPRVALRASDTSSPAPGRTRGRARRAAAAAPRARTGTGRGCVEPVRKSYRGSERMPPKNGRRGPVGRQTAGRAAPPPRDPGADERSPRRRSRQARRDDASPARAAARGSPPRSAARRPSSPSPRPTPRCRA